MLGFGKSPDYFTDLLEYAVDNFGMRTRYASAFLYAYRAPISKLHDKGLKNLEHIKTHGNSEQRMIAIMSEPEAFALVGQAYQAYLGDLRRGKHVNSEVELAVWGVLLKRVDLLETIDRGLANFIRTEQPERFPNLVDEVFTDFSGMSEF